MTKAMRIMLQQEGEEMAEVNRKPRKPRKEKIVVEGVAELPVEIAEEIPVETEVVVEEPMCFVAQPNSTPIVTTVCGFPFDGVCFITQPEVPTPVATAIFDFPFEGYGIGSWLGPISEERQALVGSVEGEESIENKIETPQIESPITPKPMVKIITVRDGDFLLEMENAEMIISVHINHRNRVLRAMADAGITEVLCQEKPGKDGKPCWLWWTARIKETDQVLPIMIKAISDSTQGIGPKNKPSFYLMPKVPQASAEHHIENGQFQREFSIDYGDHNLGYRLLQICFGETQDTANDLSLNLIQVHREFQGGNEIGNLTENRQPAMKLEIPQRNEEEKFMAWVTRVAVTLATNTWPNKPEKFLLDKAEDIVRTINEFYCQCRQIRIDKKTAEKAAAQISSLTYRLQLRMQGNSRR
ncbi:MAG: hypothetical protein WCP18_01280 [bacterium]